MYSRSTTLLQLTLSTAACLPCGSSKTCVWKAAVRVGGERALVATSVTVMNEGVGALAGKRVCFCYVMEVTPTG